MVGERVAAEKAAAEGTELAEVEGAPLVLVIASAMQADMAASPTQDVEM